MMGWSMLAVLGCCRRCSGRAPTAPRLRVCRRTSQVACDLALVTVLSAMSGGRESQFQSCSSDSWSLPPVCSAGVPGGVFAVVGAFLCRHAEHSRGRLACCGAPWRPGDDRRLRPGLVIAFLGVVGVLAGVLGERVQRARDDLEHTARELDRVRLDQDVILRHLTSGVLTVDADGRRHRT